MKFKLPKLFKWNCFNLQKDCNIKVSYIIALENIIDIDIVLPTELLCNFIA